MVEVAEAEVVQTKVPTLEIKGATKLITERRAMRKDRRNRKDWAAKCPQRLEKKRNRIKSTS